MPSTCFSPSKIIISYRLLQQVFVLVSLKRWRPKIHIFYFSVDEYYVTLENVYLLLCLPIESKAVNRFDQHANVPCKKVLGKDMIEGETLRGQSINLKVFKEYYSSISLDRHSSEENKLLKTRCYVMLLLGSQLFPKSTGNRINFMYLSLL